jgi:WD40 repeat protein/serine/threonine protein kinase
VCGSIAKQVVFPDADAVTLAASLAPPISRDLPTIADIDRPAALADGGTVPGYEILEVLGRGGMGVVYKARQVHLNRLVALKMILSGAHAGPVELARFRREAEAVAQLQHPNIVQIYEVGEHEGRAFLSLEYVEGGSLGNRLDGTPWPAPRAARLAESLARAVHVAHQQGIIHRDLKPENVLLAADDTPKITDFGLAKSVREWEGQSTTAPDPGGTDGALGASSSRLSRSQALTRTGAVLGTPSYMAPEQAVGKTKEVGPAADVYAVGAVLYELLSGRPPFRAETPLDTVLQVISAEPVPPSRLQPKVPRDLETVCLHCLHKEPDKRYPSADVLAADLRRFQEGEPIQARPSGSWERALKWARRRPAVAALMATLVLVVSGALAGLTGLWLRAEEQHAAAQLAKGDAEFQRDEAQRNLYVLHMNLALRAWEESRMERLQELLDAHRPSTAGFDTAAGKDIRGFEWYYLDRLRHSVRLTFKEHGQPVTSVAFSPDGQLLASAGQDGTMKVWEAATQKVLYSLKGHSSAVTRVAFSPDGGFIASAGLDKAIKLWDAASGKESRTFKGHAGPVSSIAFSPDGQRIAAASQRVVKVWAVATGKEVRTLEGHSGPVSCVAFSPNSKYVASGVGDTNQLHRPGEMKGEIRIFDAASGQPLYSLPGFVNGVLSLAFSPDNQRLAWGGWDRTVKVWEIASGRERRGELRTLRGHTGVVTSVAFSPDGQYIAAGSSDRTVKLWEAATEKETMTFKGHTGGVSGIVFSPDGQLLASASHDRTVKVWETTTGQEFRALKESSTGPDVCVAFSPDSGRLASAGFDRIIKVWEPATGQQLFALRGHEGLVRGLAFSPDGSRLASAGEDKLVKIWDVASGKELLSFRAHDNVVSGVAFSPDGQRLATSGSEPSLKVWDANTGQEVLTPSGHGGAALAVAYSPDGTRLATAGNDGTARLFDAATGEQLLVLREELGLVRSVAFSPDGRRLATAAADGAKIWDATQIGEPAAPLLVLKGHTDQVWCVAFSADGKRLISSSNDGTVKLWETTNGEELLTLKGHTPPVFGVALSPDGQRIASTSMDRRVRVWEASLPTPEVLLQREAYRLVESLFSKLARKSDVLDHLRRDATLREPLRREALLRAERYLTNP